MRNRKGVELRLPCTFNILKYSHLSDIRSSRGYYVNEGLGPAMPSNDIDAESDRSYATVSPTHRLASTVNHVPHNVLSDTSSNSTTASTTVTDVPRSSLRPNIAYGLEQRRNERKVVNEIRAPMRPPPRPPRYVRIQLYS